MIDTMTSSRSGLSVLAPIMFSFFVMGFVDMVGTATNYVKSDFGLSDTMANFLPSMVFLWFFFLAVPISLLMNHIGKRKTVLLSLVLTCVSMALPMFAYTYPMLLVSFCLLGLGNSFMQVSLNPVLSCVVSEDKFAGTLTFGQFIKAIASLSAPVLASWAAVRFGDWMLIYPVFLGFSIVATVYMSVTHIEEKMSQDKMSGFMTTLKMLGEPAVLVLFLGIVAHVGIDVGVNTCAPKILMERLGLPVEEAGIATTIYFLCRTLGCLSGSYILNRFPAWKFFAVSVGFMVLSMAGFFAFSSLAGLYVAIALVGFGNSNIFPMIFSKALFYKPEWSNEMSGLMVMGLIGGTIFPLFMGILSDAIGSQTGSVAVVSVGVVYLVYLAWRFKTGR
jgi:fucose permease